MSKKIPRVSVLTPIYNTNPTHLREMIESILNQTFTDFEFLILNDSPDNTEIEKIVLDYAKHDKRIKYSKNDKNMGISKSRNKLLEMACGEYIAIMDHDDISLPERFEQQVDFLDTNQHIGIVSGWLEYYVDNKPTHKYWETPEHNIDIKQGLTQDSVVCHPATMMRRSLFVDNNIKYESQYSPCEDYLLWVRMLDKTGFYNMQKPLLLYRMHDNRTSVLYDDKMKMLSRDIAFQARSKFPAFYTELRRSDNANLTTFRLRIFGIPLLKIKNNKIYLFECLPIAKLKWK